MIPKTIVMLSPKRTGSTAVFQMFQKHPDVGVCNVDQEIRNWEPNFWNLAALALKGDREPFVKRFSESHPFLKIPHSFTKEAVFDLWDEILLRLGPVVFDKSPKYLGSFAGLELLAEYKESARSDVRVFAFIRDPRDAITSQYTLWRSYVDNDSPERREIKWLNAFENLERAKGLIGFIPVFRYEDFAAAPGCYAPMIFDHCGVRCVEEAFDHIRPVHVGRYSASLLPAVMSWDMTREFRVHLDYYGYEMPQKPLIERFTLRATTGLRILASVAVKSLPSPVRSTILQVKNAVLPE